MEKRFEIFTTTNFLFIKLSSETSTSSKKKIKKIAPVASLSSTDLPLKLLPDGANIALETEKMLKKKLSKKADTPPVTQEV